MKIFPHIIVRIGGGSFKQLAKLVPATTGELVKQILKEKDECTILAENINKAIYELMPSIQNPEVQKQLLNIKRDVFNSRLIQTLQLEVVRGYLPEFLSSNLTEYIKATEKINALVLSGEHLFLKDRKAVREQFKYLVNGEKFKQGLLLSSGTLLNAIPDYLNTPSDQFRKKEYQTENGLKKYITRMYAKTSPFSTFTNLAIGRITSEKEGIAMVKDEIPYISHIRLNNYLYQYIKTLLLKTHVIYRHFPLRVNPSLTKKDDTYVFLTNHRNIESFQSMPANPILNLFVELTAAQKQGFIYKDLVETIISNEYIDAPVEGIEGLINQLLEYGFFEFNLGISGIDPDWDKKLVEKLRPIAKENELIKNLVYALEQTRVYASQYGNAEVEERKKLLVHAYELIRGACINLHENAGLPEEERKSPEDYRKWRLQKQKEALENKGETAKNDEKAAFVFKHESKTFFYFTPENIFYEDTSATISPAFDESEVNKLTDSLDKLLQEIPPDAHIPEERGHMLHFFMLKYKKDDSIDLFRFYEEYFREYKKPNDARQQNIKEEAQKKEIKKDEKNEAQVNVISAVNGEEDHTPHSVKASRERAANWHQKLATILLKDINTSGLTEEINISLDQVKQAGESVDKSSILKPTYSNSAFVQFYKNSNHLHGVLNSIRPGYGKMLSRFLHLFDKNVTQEVMKWNESAMGDALFIENCDASYFNGNIHPPLMPYEIWMPGGHNSLPEEQQIPITALAVSWNESENQLQLIHKKTKKRVYIFDLGFQIPARSKLFQLLNTFMTAEGIISNFTWSINRNFNEKINKREIAIYPRIVYEKKWVLQRKIWLIPKEHLPARNPQQSDWQYYLRINEWKEKNKMPDDVFVYVATEFQKRKYDKAAKKVSLDDYKPQYISFKNPLLIDLFEKICTKVPDVMYMVEMMPAPDQMLPLGEEPYVTECLLQWYA